MTVPEDLILLALEQYEDPNLEIIEDDCNLWDRTTPLTSARPTYSKSVYP
jgi:hypothetical protein